MMGYTMMAFSHRFILEAIRELSKEGRRVQYHEIAERAGCSTRTVGRAVKKLERNGDVVLKSKGKRRGYMFEVIDA